jgi:type I restriction enzyme S subunit
MASFNYVKLFNITTKIGSGATPTGGKESYSKIGIPFIRSQNIYSEGFNVNGLVFIDDQQASKLANVIVETDDVLLNITGDSIARSCQIPDCLVSSRVNQHVSIIRANKEFLYPKYLRFVLISPEIQEKLLALASSGATRAALTKTMIENVEIPLPYIKTQKGIANILGKLEERIELLHQMNETLESMARALFKSWFVDFDPVHKKVAGEPTGLPSEIDALFPDSFEDSNLGAIPSGWKTTLLSDFVTIKYGKDHKKLDHGKIPVYGSGGIMRYVDIALYSQESVLIPRKGTLNYNFPN